MEAKLNLGLLLFRRNRSRRSASRPHPTRVPLWRDFWTATGLGCCIFSFRTVSLLVVRVRRPSYHPLSLRFFGSPLPPSSSFHRPCALFPPFRDVPRDVPRACLGCPLLASFRTRARVWIASHPSRSRMHLLPPFVRLPRLLRVRSRPFSRLKTRATCRDAHVPMPTSRAPMQPASGLTLT